MSDCPDCQVPENAVVLSTLHLVEYLDPDDGVIYKLDISCDGAGEDLSAAKYIELSEWARMIATAPILADMVGQFLFGEDEDGTDEEISDVTV